ncbi:MAG: DUF1792 domain-containing protein [Phycisphaerae bacterium]|nr:DUF1792 domain-containing protein [Phycisphaerae bacterium]
MQKLIVKIEKELARFKKKLLHSGKKDKQFEQMRCNLDNLPYELYDKIKNDDFHAQIPAIKSIDETLDRIIKNKCSLTRFGDGEFGIMFGSRICYHDRNSKLASRLKQVLASEYPNLLIGLPPCFGSLDDFIPATTDFWRRWMNKKREMVYSYLDMNRVYHNAFLNRCYLNYHKTEENYISCGRYFGKIKKIWEDRDVIICESQKAGLGVGDGLFEDAKSISRILFCPAKNAFDRYGEILSAFDGFDSDVLILLALGPTATVLTYDLCKKGYQTIDIGMIGEEYECFLRKETIGKPLKLIYSDAKKIRQLQEGEYKRQILKTIN